MWSAFSGGVWFELTPEPACPGVRLLDTSLMEANRCGPPSCTITPATDIPTRFTRAILCWLARLYLEYAVCKKKKHDSVLIPI